MAASVATSSRLVLAVFMLIAFAAVPAIAGCHYTYHQGVDADGERGQLLFGDWSDTVLAVGYGASVRVLRFSATDVHCTGIGLHEDSASGLRIQGGDLGDPDRCDPRLADEVTLVSAACTDDTCTVATGTSEPRTINLTVTGNHAGVAHLVVSLISAVDNQTYEDEITLRFGAPARIRLRTSHALPIDVVTLPGIVVHPPSASLFSADDEELTIALDALVPTVSGDAYVPQVGYVPADANEELVATHPGHTVLRWTYPGVPDRAIDLEVVDPSEARSLYVYAPSPPNDSADAPEALDDLPALEAEPSGGRVTSVEIAQYGSADYPCRVKLTDGRYAVGPLADAVVAPETLARAYGDLSSASQSFLTVASVEVGRGTITLRSAAGPTLTLPVTVGPPSP